MTTAVNVQVIDFPTTKAAELVTENADGSYTILINARLSTNTQREAYLHALRHIRNDDFRGRAANSIEAAAHSLTNVEKFN